MSTKKSNVKKAVKKLSAKIKKDNAAFAKMTREEKRVQICKDVLAQLRTEKLVATRGTYFNVDFNAPKVKPSDLDKDVRDVLKNIPSCEVCAIGACFVAAAKRFDRMPMKSFKGNYDVYGPFQAPDINDILHSPYKMITLLKPYFTYKQLRDMETYFESGIEDANGYFKMDDEERLTNLMNSIIENNGKVVIPRDNR